MLTHKDVGFSGWAEVVEVEAGGTRHLPHVRPHSFKSSP